MSKNYMVIIVKEPNKKPRILKIPKRIKNMSNLVGGTIEEQRYENVIIVYNANQKDQNLSKNQVFEDLSLKGTILVVGNDEINGDIVSLRKKQVLKYVAKMDFNAKNKEKEI